MKSLKTNTNYSDIEFNGTDISYNYANSKATLNIDISKHYCENHTEWKNTLINLFENRMQIESLAKKVKNFAYKHYSEEKIASKWDDVISKII